jgi:hypothetical protein
MRSSVAALVFLFTASVASAGEDASVRITPVRAQTATKSCKGAFRVDISRGRVLALDFTGSAINRFADDRGTDLGKKPAGKRPDYSAQPAYIQSVAVGGGQGIEVTVRSPKPAGAQARSLSLSGSLRLKVGLDAREGQLEKVALTKGSQFILAGREATISEVRSSENSTEFAVNVGPGPKGLHFRELQIIGDGGKPVDCTFEVKATGPEDKPGYRLRFKDIAAQLAQADIRYLVIAETRMIDVPFELVLPIEGSGLAATPVSVAVGASGEEAAGGSKTSTKSGGSTGAGPEADKPDPLASVKPAGKFGLKVRTKVDVEQPVDVGLSAPLRPASNESYIITLVPASKPDDYWGWWQQIKSGQTLLQLEAPREVGGYELRLGHAKHPAKQYTVLQRVKVTVK